jgi:hypothetical protein
MCLGKCRVNINRKRVICVYVIGKRRYTSYKEVLTI